VKDLLELAEQTFALCHN